MTRPASDAELAAVVADATESAIGELPTFVREQWCIVALITTGEALRPYLGVTVHGSTRWDLADSEFAVAADDHLAGVTQAWDARGMLAEMDSAAWAAAFDDRVATLEEALRILDVRGLFGRGDDRTRVLLQVATMPPDNCDVGFVRRLNPAGPLRDAWFAEAAEGPVLPPSVDDTRRDSAPNPAMADLWAVTPGLLRDDGTCIYGPDDIAERNATFEVELYAPGWVLIGDDRGGSGYLMRAVGPHFDAGTGRSGAEVFCLDLGALSARVAEDGDFVTDDLVGWLARDLTP